MGGKALKLESGRTECPWIAQFEMIPCSCMNFTSTEKKEFFGEFFFMNCIEIIKKKGVLRLNRKMLGSTFLGGLGVLGPSSFRVPTGQHPSNSPSWWCGGGGHALWGVFSEEG